MRCIPALLFVALVKFSTAQVPKPEWQPKFLGKTNLKFAAFLEIYESEVQADPLDIHTMYISTFTALPTEYDDVFYMRSLGRYLDNIESWGENHIKLLDNSSYWPNNMDFVPNSIFGEGTEGIIQTSGFIPPGKTDGKLQYYYTENDPIIPKGGINFAANDSNDWSYHRTMWKDMDNDNDFDLLTCRFFAPPLGNVSTEFVWLENVNGEIEPGWPTHILSTEGPDVHFSPVTLNVGGVDFDCLVVGEFWNKRVTIYWTEDENNDWSNIDLVFWRVINGEAGQVFDVLVDDFNRDGIMEIMSTEFNEESSTGWVSVYFFPSDFRIDNFSSIVIADGFEAPVLGEFMTPGTPKTFYPSKAYAEDLDPSDNMPHKVWILLSGDDDGRFYVLYPETEDRNDWTYSKNILIDSNRTTVGKMDYADLDGDGYTELVLAAYSAGEIYVFTYNLV